MTNTHKLFIDNQWTLGEGEEITSRNPATNEVVWQSLAASEQQVTKAIEAAKRAFVNWSGCSFEERLSYLKHFQKITEQEKENIALTISIEVGKPLWESRVEVQTMIDKLDISVEAYQERTGIREKKLASGISRTEHKAHGVLAVFGPFNFPAHLPNAHIIPALLAGNTIVLKPSELTPMVAESIMRLWSDANLPSGVINLVQGAKKTGQALIAGDIQGVLFTGSYQVGQIIQQQLAGQLEKIIVLELGGNNPLVAWEVNDPQAAAYQIIHSSFLTSGQRCTCARRLLIPKNKSGDEVLSCLISMTRTLAIGPYNSTVEPFMGPVISPHAAERVFNKQRQLQERGANILLKSNEMVDSAAFVTPGIIDVSQVSVIEDEEVFGPQLLVIRCDDFETAIKRANATRYGLCAGLLSDTPELFKEFRQKINAGLINWNRPLTGASSVAPFGGVGLSGNFRPAGFYAADYCAHPVASLLSETLTLPKTLSPGLRLK